MFHVGRHTGYSVTLKPKTSDSFSESDGRRFVTFLVEALSERVASGNDRKAIRPVVRRRLFRDEYRLEIAIFNHDGRSSTADYPENEDSQEHEGDKGDREHFALRVGFRVAPWRIDLFIER